MFTKGKSGNPNGRPKGSKQKVRFDFAATCLEQGFDPCIELIKMARTGANDRIRLDATIELASYVEAKRKAIEISSADDGQETFQMSITLAKPNPNEATVVDVIDNIPSE